MKRITYFFILITLFVSLSQTLAGGKWYNFYNKGLKEMKQGKWAVAIENFKRAVKVKRVDTKKIRTYGMHFIEYFPHREIGICLYHLGQHEMAKRQLTMSLQQEYSARAQEYLTKLGGVPIVKPPSRQMRKPLRDKIREKLNETLPTKEPPKIETPEPTSPVVKLVGERMGIAVLPFQTTGLGVKIEKINIVEQMMTNFYNLNRFKLFERTQLEQILEEQKLGMSGIIDASTAAEIGKGIGVDAMVLGSVTKSGNNIAIDARLIDTETAEIITAQDEMCSRADIQNLKDAINRLAIKISQDLPLVEGLIINVDGDQLTIDFGSNKGVKKGIKCIAYREGEDIVHPMTGKVLGKQTEELGVIKLVQVYPEYSIGEVITSEMGMFEIGNKVITK